MYELVRVGADSLIGEIIRLEGDTATIQASTQAAGAAAAHAGLSCTRPGLPMSEFVRAAARLDSGWEQPVACFTPHA
jgi:hypothetical protein